MGTKEEKAIIAASLLDTHIDAIKFIFNKNSTSLTCIYLISLGKVGDLRKAFNIKKTYSDDSIVYKFGYTNSLSR